VPPFPCSARSGARGTGLIRSSREPFPSPPPRPQRAGETDWPRRVPSGVARPAHDGQHHDQRSADRATQKPAYSVQPKYRPRVFCGHDHSCGILCVMLAGHSPPFSAALGDLLRVALIAPGPGPAAATTPPWGDAASPVGPSYTLLADDSSLTGQRTAGAPLTHPEIPQRLPPPSILPQCRVFPSSGLLPMWRSLACTAQRLPGTIGTGNRVFPLRPPKLVVQARGGPFVHLQSS